MKNLNIPISDEDIRDLRIGDTVLLNGTMLTGRDDVHKWIIDTFVEKTREPESDDLEVYEKIKPLLEGGIIYHCGPVVSKLEDGSYKFVVYLHAIGGAATLIAESVEKVLDVHKLDFGVPEAIWVLEVKDFPVVVTMDSHGNSIHDEIDRKSKKVFETLI